MKASTYSNLEGILKDEKQQAVFFGWIVKIAIDNPKIFLTIILILVRIGKLIASVFYDKNGNRRTPLWARALGVFGIKFARQMQDIGDEVDETVKKLEIPQAYSHE
jgi:hypothetical protein